MKYPINEELRGYENWVERYLAPALQESIDGIQHKRNGKFAARVWLVKRGLKLIDWLHKAQNVEKMMRGLDSVNELKTK